MRSKKLVIGILVIIFLVIFGKLIVQAIRLSPIFFQYLFHKDIQLKKTDNRINLLLLGTGGGVHEGPNLSDTIIFANIDPSSKRVTLMSIPRDLWVPDLRAKINTAYAYGENKKKGGGLVLAKAVVAKIMNQPVDYGVRVDFAGFVEAVDQIGGLDVDVERTFDDYEYPVEGKEEDTCGHKQEELDLLATASSQLEAFPCRYMHIHFDKGRQSMDGKTALRYVRSRHAQGEEGSDFARSQRQEKVISAFKEKVISAGTLLNPQKILSLYGILQDSIDTDIKEDEFDDFIRLAQQVRGAKIVSAILDIGNSEEGREGLLMHPDITGEYENQWVLIPKTGNGNYKEIQEYLTCEIKKGNCLTPTPPEAGPTRTPGQVKK